MTVRTSLRWLLCIVWSLLLPIPAHAGEPTVRVKVDGGVQKVPLERYVLGVLTKEVYPDWPLEALKAQAVASRTYAVRRVREAREQGRSFDVEAGTGHQVYEGGAVDSDSPLRRATEETRGEGRCYAGEPIEAVFHSSCGGHTEDAGALWSKKVPYLGRVACHWCTEAPNYFWTVEMSQAELLLALAPLGVAGSKVREARSAGRPGSDRVDRLALVTDAGSYEVSGKDLRAALGEGRLRSLAFDVRLSEGTVKILGSGAGHGVGLCQWGARGQALEDRTYEEILATYYPGTTSCRLY